LLSSFHLEYPSYELLFCVAQSSDPVVPLLQRLIVLHPDVPAPLLFGNERISEGRQLRWARLRRDTFRIYFVPEIAAGGVPPLVACTIFAASNDFPVAGVFTAFGAIWYGAEAVLVYTAGWHLSWRSPFFWLVRDALGKLARKRVRVARPSDARPRPQLGWVTVISFAMESVDVVAKQRDHVGLKISK
jgi:hypothetical protein